MDKQFESPQETQFESLVEGAPDAILVIDAQGMVIYANTSCLAKFGYSRQDLLGASYELLFSEQADERKEVHEGLLAISASGRTGVEREIFFKTGQGGEFLADVTVVPAPNGIAGQTYLYIRDTSGQKYIDAIIQEIREKELAQKQLKLEKERLQSYVDNIDSILVVINEELEIILINKKGRSLLNIQDESQADIEKLHYLLQKDYGEEIQNLLSRIFKNNHEEITFYQNTFVENDGETRYLEWYLAPIKDVDGQRCILASGIDISQRKRLEELITSVAVSLQRCKEESILNSLAKGLSDTLGADVVMIASLHDRNGQQLQSLSLYHDDCFQEKLIIDIAGSPYVNIFHGQSHAVLGGLDIKYPDDPCIQRFSAQSYISVPIVSTQGNIIGILALFYQRELGNINLERNICNIYSAIAAAEIERIENEDDKKQIERQLQQAQKMESIGQLTGGIAHDFNNMLASMLGFSELAMLKADKNDIKMVDYLKNILHTGEMAKDLVSQMLTFSRQIPGEKQLLNICHVVEESVRMMRPMLPSSIYLNSNLRDQLPLIEADPVQLGQAIVNLIINARDAVGEKGGISIEIGSRDKVEGLCSSCMQDIQGRFLELKVIDTGDGVAYDKIEKIFEPFVTSKDIGKGTGMGLAMVHGIVHEHGGHVMVETSPGHGATFSLFFPVSEKTECLKEPHIGNLNSHDHKATEKLVMVVDDEIMITNLLHEILSSFEYGVETYHSGTEALQAYKSDPDRYDLVITDHTMPSMTGAELSQNILKINPDQPIILCTGYSDYMDENRAEQLGIAAFMHKPLDNSELMHTVELLTNTTH